MEEQWGWTAIAIQNKLLTRISIKRTNLCIYTIRYNPVLTLPLQIVSTVKFGKTPENEWYKSISLCSIWHTKVKNIWIAKELIRMQLPIISWKISCSKIHIPLSADNDFLTTRELEFGTAQSFLCMMAIAILATNRQKNLANAHPCTSSQRLSKCTSHSSLQPISSSTWKHFVDAQNMERMHPHSQMERILSSILSHVLVACDPSSLKSLTWDILLFTTDQMNT